MIERTVIAALVMSLVGVAAFWWLVPPPGAPPGSLLPPTPRASADPSARITVENALAYMGLKPNQPLKGLAIDRVFIGSCTTARSSRSCR